MENIKDITAVIYVRVSSDKQVREGNGLESQETRCRAYCVMQKYPVAKVFVERGISGSLYKRPAYLEMLAYLDTLDSQGVVVVDHVDRITRDVEGGAQILKDLTSRNIGLEGPSWAFENTPEGKVFFHIQTALAQYHRESNARQVRNRTAARLSNGYRSVGSCAPGYRTTDKSGLHEPYEPVASVIKELLKGYATGRFNSYTEMANYINSFRLPQRESRRKTSNRAKPQKLFIELDGDNIKNHILKNAPYYAGFIENAELNVKRTKGLHDPIISIETLENIEKRLRGEKLPIYRKNLNEQFPLRGYLLCECCEKPMMGSFCGGRNKEYAYYYCQQNGCKLKNKNIRREIIHEQFEGILKGLTPVPELVEMAENLLDGIWKEEKENSAVRLYSIKQTIAKLDNKIEDHIDELLLCKNKAVKDRLQKRINTFTEQKVTLESKYESNQLTQEDFGIVLSSVRDVLRHPHDLWKEGDLERKQLVQQLVFPNRLIYEQTAQNFRKPEKALVYCFLEELPHRKAGLVGQAGLEPATNPL